MSDLAAPPGDYCLCFPWIRDLFAVITATHRDLGQFAFNCCVLRITIGCCIAAHFDRFLDGPYMYNCVFVAIVWLAALQQWIAHEWNVLAMCTVECRRICQQKRVHCTSLRTAHIRTDFFMLICHFESVLMRYGSVQFIDRPMFLMRSVCVPLVLPVLCFRAFFTPCVVVVLIWQLLFVAVTSATLDGDWMTISNGLTDHDFAAPFPPVNFYVMWPAFTSLIPFNNVYAHCGRLLVRINADRSVKDGRRAFSL